MPHATKSLTNPSPTTIGPGRDKSLLSMVCKDAKLNKRNHRCISLSIVQPLSENLTKPPQFPKLELGLELHMVDKDNEWTLTRPKQKDHASDMARKDICLTIALTERFRCEQHSVASAQHGFFSAFLQLFRYRECSN